MKFTGMPMEDFKNFYNKVDPIVDVQNILSRSNINQDDYIVENTSGNYYTLVCLNLKLYDRITRIIKNNYRIYKVIKNTIIFY